MNERKEKWGDRNINGIYEGKWQKRRGIKPKKMKIITKAQREREREGGHTKQEKKGVRTGGVKVIVMRQ